MALIHPSSVISDKAKIGNNVKIGPFCLVGDEVELSDNVILHSHIVISGNSSIGENTVIFPFASIGHEPQDLKYDNEPSKVIIGKNNKIREYVTIQPGTKGGIMETRIGDNCLLMTGTHIAHDCIVGDNVIFANLATLAGHVIVGDNVVIGGLSAIHQFVRIGTGAMIGGGTIVERDLSPFTLIVEDRAGISGLNIVGLKRKGYDKNDIINLQKAFKKIFFEDDGDLNSRIELAEKEFSGNELLEQMIEFLRSDSKRSFTMGKK